jgi:hypothetical protein
VPNASWQANVENRVVETYLQFLATGTLPPPPNLTTKQEQLQARIDNEPRLFMKVKLVSEMQALAAPSITAADLREGFVKHAPGFSERNHITYKAWREMGVPVAVLREMGMAVPSGGKPGPHDYPRTRNKMTEEFGREFLAYLRDNGPEGTAKHYSYKYDYITQLRQRLLRLYPALQEEFPDLYSPRVGRPPKNG